MTESLESEDGHDKFTTAFAKKYKLLHFHRAKVFLSSAVIAEIYLYYNLDSLS